MLTVWLSSSLLATTLATSPAPVGVGDDLATRHDSTQYHTTPRFGSASPEVLAARARKHRLRGFGWAIAGTGGLLTTTVLQSRAGQGKVPCIQLRSGHRACSQADGLAGSALHAAGLTTFVVGSAGMAFAFGRAHAYDATIERRPVRSAVLGMLVGGAIVGASQGFFAAGLRMAANAEDCESEQCRLRNRSRRYALMDLGAMGTALGAGISAFVLGRQFQSRRLESLEVVPALSRTSLGASVSARF